MHTTEKKILLEVYENFSKNFCLKSTKTFLKTILMSIPSD